MKTDKAPRGVLPLSRRRVLGSAASLGLIPLAAAVPGLRAAEEREAPRVLSTTARAVLTAFVDRLVPSDDNGPGAVEAGVPDYIERSLAEWNQGELPRLQTFLEALDAYARDHLGAAFAAQDGAARDALLSAMESGSLEELEGAQAVFNRLHRLTLEGMFCDPYYGGNRGFAGWDLIGYPGAVLASTPDMQRMGVRLPPLHTSAYGADYDGD